MQQGKGIRKFYAEEIRNIKERINRKKIDVQKVMESYASGMGEEHIKILYKLDKDELSYILRNHLTQDIISARKKSQEVFNNFNLNLMGLPVEKSKKKETRLTLQEAIAIVEGKREGSREERE